MRIKLKLSKKNEEAVAKELTAAGIEISDQGEFVLTEENDWDQRLRCKDGADTVIVPIQDICYMESIGHNVFVCTDSNRYKTELRIYQLEALLPEDLFIRISNSVIIRRNSIERIRPALSCKFILHLTNGDVVDVTRTYYYKFKEFYGI